MLYTIGHGTLAEDDFVALLRRAGIERIVDVRRVPQSQRHPQFQRETLERTLSRATIAYAWEPRLGGWRKRVADSPNVALRNASFRNYADYMRTDEFHAACEAMLAASREARCAILCSESLWWRCHRRLIADFVALARGGEVAHVLHAGRIEPHRPTAGVRPVGDGVVYDEPVQPELGISL